MQKPYVGHEAGRYSGALLPRIGATLALVILASLHFASVSAWSADPDSPNAAPPPNAGLEHDGGEAQPGSPPLYRDQPSIGEDEAPDSSGNGRPPFQGGGCPYRGTTLELIV